MVTDGKYGNCDGKYGNCDGKYGNCDKENMVTVIREIW